VRGNPYHLICEGPIRGLRLPRCVWDVLKRERIETLDQLKTVADRIDRWERIGPWSARMVRRELARMTQFEEQFSESGKASIHLSREQRRLR